MPFYQQVVIVTGASSGIGQVLVSTLVDQGAHVVLAARSEAKLDEIAQTLPGNNLVVPTDVTKEPDVKTLVDKTIQTYGRIDYLINNAGYGVFAAVVDADVHDFRGMMDVNYFGTVLCTKYVLPHMLKANKGHIINMASVAGKIATAKSAAYAASKFAVIGFTDSLRLELNGTGIEVTTICPGPVETPFFDRADADGQYVAKVKSFMIKPEEVVCAVLKTAEKPQAEIILPNLMKVVVRLSQSFPNLVRKVGRRWMNQK